MHDLNILLLKTLRQRLLIKKKNSSLVSGLVKVLPRKGKATENGANVQVTSWKPAACCPLLQCTRPSPESLSCPKLSPKPSGFPAALRKLLPLCTATSASPASCIRLKVWYPDKKVHFSPTQRVLSLLKRTAPLSFSPK